MRKYLEFIGNIGLFALTAVRRVLVPPLEVQMILLQLEVMGWKSLPLVLSSGESLWATGHMRIFRSSIQSRPTPAS